MIKLDSKTWNIINEGIYHIHAEINLTKLRTDILDILYSLIPYDRAFFDLGIKKSTHVDFFDPIAKNMEQKYLKLYFSKYEEVDTMYWFFSQNRTEIYRETDFVSEKMRRDSVFYNEWLKPQNIFYSMGSMVLYKGILYGSINLWRSKKMNDFTDRDIGIMTILNRHISMRFNALFPNGFKKNDDLSSPLISKYHLTKKESLIAGMLYEGKTVRTIATELFLSEDTIKKHSTHIYKKLKVSGKPELIKLVHSLEGGQ